MARSGEPGRSLVKWDRLVLRTPREEGVGVSRGECSGCRKRWGTLVEEERPLAVVTRLSVFRPRECGQKQDSRMDRQKGVNDLGWAAPISTQTASLSYLPIFKRGPRCPSKCITLTGVSVAEPVSKAASGCRSCWPWASCPFRTDIWAGAPQGSGVR